VILNRDSFSSKLKDIQSKLPANSHLLIVSKTRSAEEIRAYYELGHRDFGENRVQELLEKSEYLKQTCPEIRWHMIGNIQSNKIPQLFSVTHLWAIHSVDNKNLLEKMLKAEGRLNSPLNIFLQYNTSKEEEKSGFEDYAALKVAAMLIPADSRIKLYGIMTMGTLRTENFEIEARRCFQELNNLKKRLSNDLSRVLQTSMGMSQDYQIALQENSNWLRLGSTMF
jgi:pyridoxal phosphate enzyme (YggS family)